MDKYSLSVPVVLSHPFPSLEGMSTSQAESIFVTLRDTAKENRKKHDYDYCCKILKYAGKCDASLVSVIRNSRFIVRFNFEFETFQKAKHFLANFPNAIQ